MRISKRQLRRIVKEEKQRVLSEGYKYDPAEELNDVMQFLSDAHMRLEEVAYFSARQNPDDRRVLQLDSLAREVKKIQHSVGTHTNRAYKEPAPK